MNIKHTKGRSTITAKPHEKSMFDLWVYFLKTEASISGLDFRIMADDSDEDELCVHWVLTNKSNAHYTQKERQEFAQRLKP